MIDVPSGFITVPTSDGSYIPFFVKVRGEDIVWDSNTTLQPYIKTIMNDDECEIINVNSMIYKINLVNKRKILIDDQNYIYFKNNIGNTYTKYSTSTFKYHTIDMNDDGHNDNCLFIYGESTESNVPHINIVTDRLLSHEYTWNCRVSSDGFITAQTFIPICNYVVRKRNNIDTYICYSNFDYDRTVTYMDTLTLNNFKLPVTILSDSFNIQISKKSNLKEFTNTFVGSTPIKNTTNITYNENQYSFDTINNVTVELNGINKIADSDSFAYIMKKCGIYINISGYMPMIEN